MHHSSSKQGGDEPVVPFISADRSLPEITVKAIVLGFILSAVLAGANAYLGLKVGLTVSASIPAAVISMAVLRMFRESNILENNIVQTSASAGESVAAGIIFTLPALILLEYWHGFPFLPTMAVAVCGGILGVLFTIPLRRALIVEAKLQFPEGVATGEVLKAGTEGGKGAKLIAISGLVAAGLKLAQSGFKVFATTVTGGVTAGRSVFGVASDISVALLGVGYIVGLNIATLVFGGGLISWFLGIPIYMALADPAELASIVGGATGYEAAENVWSAQIRYLGVGAMVVGGVWALISLIKPIKDGVRVSLEAFRESRSGNAVTVPRTEQDTPINYVFFATLAMAVPVLIVFLFVVNQDALGIGTGLYWSTIGFGVLFSLTAGFLFSSVAGYMAGLVGSSNNPISGVTIATILTISLILLVLLGQEIDFAVNVAQATAASATAILVGGVVCCAAAIAGDNMQDLKAGQLVGATPYKQQIMQIVGVIAASLAIAPVLDLLFQAYGLGGVMPRAGMDASEMLQAPQATLMSSVADGVFTLDLPWTMIAIGAVLAVIIIAIDKQLEAREASFRMPVLAVAVGIYLPLALETPMFIGGLLAYGIGKYYKGRKAELGEEGYEKAVTLAHRRGLLFSSGLITGEALVGIALAIPFALFESTDVLRLMPAGMETISDLLGIGAFIFFAAWLYRIAKGEKK